MKKFKIVFNSPVIVSFAIICLVATLLGAVTGGLTNTFFFSVYRSSLSDPLTYFRFLGHVFGHMGYSHFIGNMTLLLLIGPLLEEKYGSKNIIYIILITAVITGAVQFIFFNSALLGASGVVFAFILLSSFTSIKDDGIPITFVLVALLYMSQELYGAFFSNDNVSQLTHIIGGIVGAVIGFMMKGSARTLNVDS